MRENLMNHLFDFISSPFKRLNAYRESTFDLLKLRASLVYVKGIDTARLLFISLLGVGLCLVFIFTSLALFHTTLFLYAPLTAQTKMIVGFAFAAAYLGIALYAFSYVFSQGKWLKIFHAEQLLEDLAKKASETKQAAPESGAGMGADEKADLDELEISRRRSAGEDL